MENKKLRFRGKRFNKASFILIALLFIAIGFAINDTTLDVKGTLGFKKSWNISIANITVTSGSVSSEVPTITSNNSSFSLAFNSIFTRLNDYYEFEADIINDGIVEAKIYSFTSNTSPEKYADYYKYEITYADGSPINVNDVIAKGQRKRFKVRIAFNVDADLNFANVIGKNHANEDRTMNFTCDIAFREAE